MTEIKGLVDKRAYLGVLGCLLQDISLIDDIDRPLDRTDFNTESFYELLFVSIYNLYNSGCQKIDEFSIDSYLSNYKDQYQIFQENNGLEYLVNARDLASIDNYEYNYHRLRKYSLLRYYESQGLDTRFIFDSTQEGVAGEKEQIKFDNYTEQEIVEIVENTFVVNPTTKFCTNSASTNLQAGDGLDELIDELMQTPDVGMGLNNAGLNTVTRGARKGCLYMQSSPSGFGKTRSLAGNALRIAVPYVWNDKTKKYDYTGCCEPTLYITTELPPDEIQTMFIAGISHVNEEHILYGNYVDDELDRVRQAVEYIKQSPLYIVHIPDFSSEDIKNIIKQYHREYSIGYVFFDYIFTSMRLMAEINGRTKAGLKEHQLLLVFCTELKTIAQQLNVFIFTASQTNANVATAEVFDSTAIAGAKSLSNKLDVGMITTRITPAIEKKLEPIMHKMVGCKKPNCGHYIYKVRRGKFTRIIIWTYCDLGIMTEEPLFCTDYDFNLIPLDFTKIEMVEQIIKDNSVLLSTIQDEVTEDDLSEEEKEIVNNSFDW